MILGFKASETLLGIETIFAIAAHWSLSGFLGFKASETLLGIETLSEIERMNWALAPASKPLKPF